MLTFLHLHKCGGTYVHNALLATLPHATFAPRDPSGHISFPAPSDKKVIISGHLSARDIRLRLQGIRPVSVILREPLERFLSHYYFLKSYEPSNLAKYNNTMASAINEANLAEVAENDTLLSYFKDYYLRRLDPKWHQKSPRKPSVSRAIDFLRGCNAIGVTSCMEGFLARIETVTDLKLCRDVNFANRRDQLIGLNGFRQTYAEDISLTTIKLLDKALKKDKIIYNFALSNSM